MTERSFDAIVVGGGPGGYVCAIRLGQLGVRTACVEAEELGGVCLNWGCIPSKALITTAHFFVKAQSASEQGLTFGSVSVDAPKMQAWKDGIVKKLTGGVRLLLKGSGVELVEGTGRLVDRTTVEVTRRDGARERLTAHKGIVLATGSSTIQIPGFELDGKQIIGAREAVSLHQVPKRLLVIGGGVIGLELGMAFQAFGSELTVVELTPGLLPGIDAEAVRVVERSLTKRGARVLKEAKAESWDRNADGSLTVFVSSGGTQEQLPADIVLVAVGMRPRSQGLGLEEIGVKVDAHGFVPTDERCQTNVPGVYAIGDVSGLPMLAHKASKEGEVCAEVLAGEPAAKDWAAIPGVVFTDPEIATVGLTEQAAREQGLDVKVGKFPFAALGRAMSLRETDGFVKILTDGASGRLVGIHIVGPGASDLISEASLALEMVATADDLAMTVHPHPTLGEAMMEAAAHSLGRAIHIRNR